MEVLDLYNGHKTVVVLLLHIQLEKYFLFAFPQPVRGFKKRGLLTSRNLKLQGSNDTEFSLRPSSSHVKDIKTTR